MKPHIKKVNGEWDCNGHKSNSPCNAYFMWQFRATKRKEFERLIGGMPYGRDWPVWVMRAR